jgi:glycosyltransferase involved in cell wall biosynthesis
MNKTKISLTILTKNESDVLKKNLNWINQCPAINEIIFVDDESTDDTLKTIRSLKLKNCHIKLFERKLNHDFSSQRQFAISKASNNLVLWLDPDEHPSNEIIGLLNNIDKHQYDNYAFLRSDIFLGKELKHGETSSQYFLRLFDKRYGQFTNLVHETWQSSKPVRNFDFPIIHHSHPNLKSFIEKINFYTDIRSQELHNRGVKTNILQIIFYPLAKFIQNYFLRLGLLDGTPGIIIALGMSFHSFLVRAKLWTLQNQS